MSYRDRGPQQPPLPKPYDFVPLPEGSIPTKPPAGHHHYAAERYTGVLRATLIARSPVHVASGLLQPTKDQNYPLVKGHFRTQERLAIPGTSLKGCIRSVAEAISRASVQVTRARELDRRYLPAREADQLDVVQRIFGALGYQGMLRIADALLPVETQAVIVPSPQLFRPRSEATDVYFEGRRARGRKFYMHGKLAGGDLPLEACPVESHFPLHMDFENVSGAELGLVLTALGLSAEGQPRFWLKLGGGKPACLGTIEVSAPTLSVAPPQAAYSDFDVALQPLAIAPLLEAAQREGLVLAAQLDRVTDILRWPRPDRQCPDRSY